MIDGSGCEALFAGAIARGRARLGSDGATAATALSGIHKATALPRRPDVSAWQALDGLSGLGPHGFAQGGVSDRMHPGPLLEILVEQAITTSPQFMSVPAHRTMRPGAKPFAAASVAAGRGPLAGIPGIPGADGVRYLSDDELLGSMSAAQRLQNRADWLEMSAVAELTRRRHAEQEASAAGGSPVGQRAGEFASEEIAFETVCSGFAADERMELAEALATRLRASCARMAEGAIGAYKARIIHRATRDLSPEDAAAADAILAEEAAALTPEALRRRALRVAMTLDPEAADKRKKTGTRQKRVEMWPEDSGNAALAGREMDPADALAASAYYDALARTLRKGGVPGTLRELRHLAFTDRNTGKDPLDRIASHDGQERQAPQGTDAEEGHVTADARATAEVHATGATDEVPVTTDTDALRDDGYRDDEPGGHDPWCGTDLDDAVSGPDDDGCDGGVSPPADPAGSARSGSPEAGPAGSARSGSPQASPAGPGPGGPPGGAAAPVPANINVLVPVGTLLGWSGVPGEASGLGPLDPRSTRDLIQAASRHPGTRWCVTFTGPDGTATGHGCAPGRRPWQQSDRQHSERQHSERQQFDRQQTGSQQSDRQQSPWQQREWTRGTRPEGTSAKPAGREDQTVAFLNWLGVAPEPIARGSCDHRHQEDQYTPSRKLAHLIRARTATCCAPACGARAEHNDLDHTIPWPEGPTDECNLGPPCRHHHRVKQAPGWKLEQIAPGIMRWTTPSGRSYTTRPTAYDTGDDRPAWGG